MTEAISSLVEKKGIATLPSVIRALKDDLFILRKCPWGAMTRGDYNKDLQGRGGSLEEC